MNRFAIIGGTGAAGLIPEESDQRQVETPYGDPSGPILSWESGSTQVLFIARHGSDGDIPPHRVNYRANVWALYESQPDFVLAINAVGGIRPWARPGQLVVPDQLIDYTWGREHTFADGTGGSLRHVEFSSPFSAKLRARLIAAANDQQLEFSSSGTYAVTQGPRLETAAEIDRLERDGCHIVGMTAMPEAALCSELEMQYAVCAVVVNWAAGRGDSGKGIHHEIHHFVDEGMSRIRLLIDAL
jgi:5'-methylthioinosine phosphorylase